MIAANDHHRDTPLLARIRAEIERDGPIPVSRYMQLCLTDPDAGYYSTQRAIGAEGDFITAPEISQIFGELVGLWCAVVWQTLGQPARFELVELGPGRGILMNDALRACQRVPGFADAARVRLVEVSPSLRAEQERALAQSGFEVSWHADLGEIAGNVPLILIANEFLDALPIEQFVMTDEGPAMRAVALGDDGQLVFTTDKDATVPDHVRARLAQSDTGSIAETAARGFAFLDALAQSGVSSAGLLVDYGHEEAGIGETLQAVRGHQFEHVLTSPGEADLSAQVDFEGFARAARDLRFEVDGPVPQAEFLGRLGILQRASRLMNANPEQAGEVEAGVLRLMAPNGMGTRFKAIGIRTRDCPPLPGFADPA